MLVSFQEVSTLTDTRELLLSQKMEAQEHLKTTKAELEQVWNFSFIGCSDANRHVECISNHNDAYLGIVL